jgi:polyisoprenoid-binding protein YceI
VKEQFAGAVIESDATGKTATINGTMNIDGNTISNVTITADLSTLESDKAQRDRKLADQGLQTKQFPEAKFVLTEPIKLAAAPQKGQTIQTNATGDFTLHGVTKRVTVPLEGRWDGETVQVIGKVPITFADYGIDPPNIGGFVSVRDKGQMELQLFFVKQR